jgi:hypothetical protein
LDNAPKGLSEDTVRFISAKEDEPAWMLERRLDAYRRWLTVREPHWARVDYGPSDYQDLYYYSAPRRNVLQSLDEVDPEILRTYEKLGIPLREREILAGVERPEGSLRVAVDAVFDSVSVATTFQQELAKAGVLFMPISEALQKHPQLVKKYRGTLVPISYNFFATLNSAVFSGGSSVQEIFERAAAIAALGDEVEDAAVPLGVARVPILRRRVLGAHTVPYIEAKNASTMFAHEASSRRSPRPCCSTADSAACDDYRRNEPAHNVIPPAQGITLHSFTLAIAKSFANFGEVLIRRVVTIIRIAS